MNFGNMSHYCLNIKVSQNFEKSNDLNEVKVLLNSIEREEKREWDQRDQITDELSKEISLYS